MVKQIRIGVLGCASIAQRFVIPAIQSLDSLFELVGVASRNKKDADEFASQFNCLSFEDYEALIDNEAIDAVYIPLPNSLHYEWVKSALLKNKHVLVEKSLACTLSDVVELNNIARERKLALIENFQFRFHPQLECIKNIIASGEIGDIRQVHSRFGFPPFEDKSNIRYQSDLGGGALLDAGAYPIKVTQEILGFDVEVVSSSLHIDEQLNVDLWGNAQLNLKNSAVSSHISFGFEQYYQCLLEVWGSKGLIKAGRIFTAPPGYSAEVEVQTQSGSRTISIEETNHFQNMLTYFSSSINCNEKREFEYKSNVNQAHLISNILKVHHAE
ncbi:Gfo/Idh/MocA family protein [Vibrio coralliirubri]|uniref:Gfo/Idh/MocA family protein n=1 Tax=Vibrio coralliirubri TaxID=1516159 RepID=UPI002FE2E481